MTIRKLSQVEIKKFLPLVWDCFCEFEAPNYPESAKLAFKQAIYDENYLEMLTAYGAYKDGVPIGIIATREEGKHIALFFVDGKYHRQGIGRQLWDEMRKETPENEFTVHSSLYAVPVYEKLGFIRVDGIQTENGITYQPMMFKMEKNYQN